MQLAIITFVYFLGSPAFAQEAQSSMVACNSAGKNTYCGDFSEGAFAKYESEENSHVEQLQAPYRAMSPKFEPIFQKQKDALEKNQRSRREACGLIKGVETRALESLKKAPKDTSQCESYAELKRELAGIFNDIETQREQIYQRWTELDELDGNGLEANKKAVDALTQERVLTAEQRVEVHKKQLWQFWQHGTGPVLCRFHSGLGAELHRMEQHKTQLAEKYGQLKVSEESCRSMSEALSKARAGASPPARKKK